MDSSIQLWVTILQWNIINLLFKIKTTALALEVEEEEEEEQSLKLLTLRHRYYEVLVT